MENLQNYDTVATQLYRQIPMRWRKGGKNTSLESDCEERFYCIRIEHLLVPVDRDVLSGYIYLNFQSFRVQSFRVSEV